MKIFIMTDMEGVCGVINHDDWVMPSGRYYEEGKRLLTLEVNEAAAGFFEAGATEVYVADGHGQGGINQALLDDRTYLIRGFPDPWPFMLDSSFDAAAWVGMHAKAGTPYAHIAHTQWFNYLDFTINGISVGEFGQLAYCGAFLGVRSIFGSGDEAFTKEAQKLINGIETVAVKKGITPRSGDDLDCDSYRKANLAAIHMHPERARKLIRESARNALERFARDRESFQLLTLVPPYKLEAKFRPDGDTPAYEARAEHPDDLIKAFNTMW